MKAKATLGSGNLRQAVILPPGEDSTLFRPPLFFLSFYVFVSFLGNEWLAVNTVDFFNQINLLYGSITEFCTDKTCPIMNAGPKYDYHWMDGVQVGGCLMHVFSFSFFLLLFSYNFFPFTLLDQETDGSYGSAVRGVSYDVGSKVVPFFLSTRELLQHSNVFC